MKVIYLRVLLCMRSSSPTQMWLFVKINRRIWLTLYVIIMELSHVLFCVAANIYTQPFLLSNHHTLRGSIQTLMISYIIQEGLLTGDGMKPFQSLKRPSALLLKVWKFELRQRQKMWGNYFPHKWRWWLLGFAWVRKRKNNKPICSLVNLLSDNWADN